MGEKQETDQRSPNSGKRPSPNSVKELLDIVHLQQATVPLNVAVKQSADRSARGGFNPLPAIGQSACSYPAARNTSPPPHQLQTAVEKNEGRARANSDGYQYSGRPRGQHGLSASTENDSVMPGIPPARDGPHLPVPSTPSGRPTQQRRERTLPPLSELKSADRPQSRQGQGRQEVSPTKSALRRTSSGNSQGPTASVDRSSRRDHEECTPPRPKSSHGRRRPLPSEIIAIHNSAPAPYDDGDVFAPDDARRPRNSTTASRELSQGDRPRPQRPAPSSRQQMLERPKSSKGRTRRRARTTGSLSQGDDWSSDEDARPRAPSPPSPGLDSDLDSGNEGYGVSNGRSVRPR